MSNKEYEPCLDCDGSGEDGAGGPCPICDGAGQAEAALAELEGRG